MATIVSCDICKENFTEKNKIILGDTRDSCPKCYKRLLFLVELMRKDPEFVEFLDFHSSKAEFLHKKD